MARRLTVLEGTTVRSACTFRDAGGSVTDPQTVQVTWKGPSAPDEVHVYPTSTLLIRISEGVYRMDRSMRAGEKGVWYTHWQSGGIAAAEEHFTVKAPSA